MAPLDTLPADQRAVLQLVLQRGRSYEQIGGLLRIEPAAVRRRALRALDAIAPDAALPERRRELIADYLLGQLPEAERPRAAAALAESAGERDWARVVASELEPLAGGRLPPIPQDGEGPEGLASDAAPGLPDEPAVAESQPALSPEVTVPPEPAGPEPDRTAHSPQLAAPPPPAQAETAPRPEPAARPRRLARWRPLRTSRRGGPLLIGLTVVLVAVLIVLLVTRGSGGSHRHGQPAASTSARSVTSASSASHTSSTAATVLGQINLTPANPSSKAAGVAEVLKEGASDGVAIVADNVPPNTTNPPNAYAVWLYNSPTSAYFLGFVDPGVGANGRLSTAGALPADASRYKELVITVETSTKPKAPGPILLQGPLNGL